MSSPAEKSVEDLPLSAGAVDATAGGPRIRSPRSRRARVAQTWLAHRSTCLTSVASNRPSFEESIDETLHKRWVSKSPCVELLLPRYPLRRSRAERLFLHRALRARGSSPYAVVVADLPRSKARARRYEPKVSRMFTDLRRARDVRKRWRIVAPSRPIHASDTGSTRTAIRARRLLMRCWQAFWKIAGSSSQGMWQRPERS